MCLPPLLLFAAFAGGLTSSASAAGAAAPSAPAPATLAGAPSLYVVDGPVGPERPRVYVVFATRSHLHEPRTVVAKLDGRAGRTYADRRGRRPNCYRSALSLSAPANSGPETVVPGRTYSVSFVQRSSARVSTSRPPFATSRLRARSLHAGSLPPTCA